MAEAMASAMRGAGFRDVGTRQVQRPAEALVAVEPPRTMTLWPPVFLSSAPAARQDSPRAKAKDASGKRGALPMASEKQSLPYGLWPSPISPAQMAAGMRLGDPTFDSDGQTLIWLEGRSDRGVLVAQGLHDQAARDLTADRSVRARVGYGGGDFAVHDGMVYYAADGRLHRQPISGGGARAITPAFGEAASPAVSPDGRRVAFVHSYERRDAIAVVDAAGDRWPQRIVHGEDFYMQPAWHPDGRRLAYVCWNHPHMPWDGTWVRIVDVDTGEVTTVAGGEDALVQPAFSPDGDLLAFASDATGWWNLYLHDLKTGTTRQLTTQADAEAGGRTAWGQGLRTLAWSAGGRSLVYLLDREGFTELHRVALNGEDTAVPLPEYTALSQIAASPRGDAVALVAASSRTPSRIVVVESGEPRVIRRSAPESIPAEALAAVQPITWPTADGSQVYGLYYPPASPTHKSPGLPPAVILIHGGPTGQSVAGWSSSAQFFATRGYAVLDVNYRGSSGYGRRYRDLLIGTWGMLDVEDAVSGGRFLAKSGLADGSRLVIMGGSAGGYTVLRALTTQPGFFRAGVCLYGVSNLFTLAAETHKFEERYMDSMVGPLPEEAARYRERSPIFTVDKIVDPIAVYQGEVDVVVPKNQADTVVESLRRRGVPHEYTVYAGEGHGWRRADTIDAFYRSVDAFLRQYVIFA
ncbi:MAG TPA: S9 family peptidase [Bacillota bacterium]|nr:S9 family peptidase [Bacillota bacterium]